ncbi:MAG: DUF3536 domain-containing protein [Thermodesulfobacteriota bacterium]
MKNAFVAIHGHFYQPPRENPWLEIIEREESAFPFHDWNERITSECYRPNAYARILDAQGKIIDLFNNYSMISFNFGPTLLSWLDQRFPSVYQKILEADRESLRRWGYGNAIAQVYNHIIMPLAVERDKETEVLWGIADFERRFHRTPEAMWLPETAVDYPTLRVLIKHGMRYLILSPYQASRVRPFEGKRWTDVSQGRIDPTQPYRCFLKDLSGKKVLDQYIDIFFYEGAISKEVAFGDLLRNGDLFCERFAEGYLPSRKRPQLIHIATDGETYGHHKKFGDMALAYGLQEGFSSRGLELINYGAYLKRFPPTYEVEIDEGPKGEGSSWSCAHGVGRWKEDCGCSTGGREGWNQKWRKPLRESLNFLRDELSSIFEEEGGKIFKDVWKARDHYIEILLERTPEKIERFFETYGISNQQGEARIKGLKLLEMERHGLLMFTSCGWFFADLSGLETVQILKYAGRAIQLAEELTGRKIEERFLEHLKEAKSNLSEMGDGRQVYERLVKPKSVGLDQVVNHFAISSLVMGVERKKKLFSYQVECLDFEKIERENKMFALGKVKVTPEIIPESKEFIFGVLPSKREVFQTRVLEQKDTFPFDLLKDKFIDAVHKGEGEAAQVLTSYLGDHILTIQDILKEERQRLFQKLIEGELEEHRRLYAELFIKTRHAVEALIKEGLEVPYEIRVAAEVTLNDQLCREAQALQADFKGTLERGEIDRIVQEAKEFGYHLSKEKVVHIFHEILNEKMRLLQEAKGRELKTIAQQIQEILIFLEWVERWGFELPKEEAQNRMDEMLDECIEGLDQCWVGEMARIPFPPNLFTLAERLGFNVDRFPKIPQHPETA